MKPEWYYTSAGQQFGPFTAAEMKKFGEEGKLKPDDLVWKEGMANWVAAKAVKGILPVAVPVPVKPAEPEVQPLPSSGPANDFDYEQPAPGPVSKRGKPAKKSEREAREDVPPASDSAFEDASPGDEQSTDFDDRREFRKTQDGGLMAYLTFRKMIVPVIIQIIFWMGVLACLGGGGFLAIGSLASGRFELIAGGLFAALMTVVLGILMVRIYCELLIVSFRILSTLTEIKSVLEKRG